MRRLAFVAICLVASCSRSKPAPQPDPIAAAPVMATDQIGQPGSTNLAPLAGLPHELDDETSHRPASRSPSRSCSPRSMRRASSSPRSIKCSRLPPQPRTASSASHPTPIGIAVCEYPSHEAALAGRKMMDSRFAKLVPDAVREVNGATLVTVANASQHVAVRDQILTTFRTL